MIRYKALLCLALVSKGVLSRREAGGMTWVPELVTIWVRACTPIVCNDLSEATMGLMFEFFMNVHWSNM